MAFRIDKTLEINAPAEVVWQVITDLPRYGEWNPFVRECRSTLKPGDVIEMTVQLTAKPQKVVEVMNEFVPGRRFAYHMKPAPLGALHSLRAHNVEPAGPGTSRYRSEFMLDGWLMPLVRGLLGGAMARGFEGMSQGIKRRAEELWARQQPSARRA